MPNNYLTYLELIKKPFKKLTKLEFLNPDNSVAFSIGSGYHAGYSTARDTRAFIQSGSLSVSLQNGQRRKATITLANLDGAFDYAVNKLWFGQRLRLQMGVLLPDGTEFYLPQGVFYCKNPQNSIKPTGRTITYNLVDKWTYLDGTLFGKLQSTYIVGRNENIFDAMQAILNTSRYTLEYTNNTVDRIDNVAPVFTTYYNTKQVVSTVNGVTTLYPMNITGYELRADADNDTFASVLTELNETIAGWIGYNANGELQVDPSQDDISDTDKPVLWTFTPENSNLLGITETVKNAEVYNDIIITGEGLEDNAIWGRATNIDASSDTNINLIGRHVFREAKSSYWNAAQCVDLATFYLKKKTILAKSVTIESTQMFHLKENQLVAVVRTDKEGSPVEKHLIQSFTLPIGENGSMTINCTSVNDLPNLATQTSQSE